MMNTTINAKKQQRMKGKRAIQTIFFFFVLSSLFIACKNPWVTEILKVDDKDVSYTLQLDTTGLAGGDAASFSATEYQGEITVKSKKVALFYTLTGANSTDRLIFSFQNTPAIIIETPGTSSFDYIVNSKDIVNKVITITVQAIHTNLEILHEPGNVLFDQDGTITFTGADNAGAGEIFYTFTLKKDGIAVEGFVDQLVNSGDIPEGIVDALLSDDGAYTVTVKANTGNPDYMPSSIESVPSDPLYVYSVAVAITGMQSGEKVSAERTGFSTEYDADGTYFICAFKDDTVIIRAEPGNDREILWNEGSKIIDNIYAIEGITENADVAVIFSGNIILEGTADITGINKIDAIISLDISNVSAGGMPVNAANLNYQWLADNVPVEDATDETYTILAADLGKVITCLISHKDTTIPGEIIAERRPENQPVPYTLKLDTTGLTDPGDFVSFDATEPNVAETTASEGAITIYYTLSGDENTNELTLSFMATASFVTSTAGDGTYTYTLDPDDAVNGIISISASSIHTNLILLNASNFSLNDTDKEYNASPQGATVAYTGGLNALVAGDITVYYSGAGATDYPDNTVPPTNAGNYNVLVSTSGSASYAPLAKTMLGTLVITQKPVTITGLGAEDKMYDGGTAATITGTGILTGNLDGGNLSIVPGTASFADKNAGTGKTVTFSDYSLGGSAAENYALPAQPADVQADITQLRLIIDNPTGAPVKVYDGSTAYTGSGITLGALLNRVGSDNVSAAIQSATYNNANVVSANQITVVYSISGSDAGNYLPPNDSIIAANITPAVPPAINWPSGLTSNEGLTLADILLPDNGAGTPGSFSWTSGGGTSVGSQGANAHNVTFTPSSSNYSTVTQDVTVIVGPPLVSALVLSPSPISFTGITYGDAQPAAQTVTITNNGTAAAAVSGITLSGINAASFTVGGSTTPAIGAGGTATFTLRPNANLGAGAHNARVTVTYDDGETVWATVTIQVDPKALTIDSAAHTKVYDGNTSANGVTVTLGGIVSGDTVAADAVTAVYTGANAGTTTINISSVTLTGAAAANYAVTPRNGITVAGITQRPITVTPTSGQSKAYGAPDPAFTYTPSEALIAGNSFTGALAYSGSNVGTYPFTLGTLSAGSNYTLSLGGSVSFAITPAAGNFGTPAAITVTYTTGLTLASLNSQLAPNYAWVTPGTALSAGSGQSFAATYTDPSGNYLPANGSITVNVNKAAGATVATPATLNSASTNSITVNAAVLTAGTGQSVEYAINQSGSTAPSTGWQSGLNFGSLNPDTVYYVWARSAESANYNAGLPMASAAMPTNPVTSGAIFNITLAQLQNESELLPWEISGGSGTILTLSRSGSAITLSLTNPSAYGSISWELEGALSSGSSFTLDPANYTPFDDGSYSLYVEVVLAGVNYGRSIQFIVTP